MAFARGGQSIFDENVGEAAGKAGARQPLLQPGARSARAPLGEIGNFVGTMATRALGGGKADACAKPAAGAEVNALLNNIRDKTQSWATTRQRAPAQGRPVTRSSETSVASAVAQRVVLDGSRSLSTLLQKRSEAEESDLPDIDAVDKENPLAVCEYVNSIYSYYYRVEGSTAVSPAYMSNQADINDKMRAILVDWLVEVHLKFKLMPETLFLTVNLIDRYLSLSPVSRKNLQLVGVTAMLLASKYEEIWAPEVRDFVYISDKAYTREQILACEKGMLNTLGFHLTVPTPFQFLTRLSKAAGADKEMAHLAQFYMELALPDYSCLRYKSSEIAAAALYCAIRTLRHTAPGSSEGWTHALQRHSRYSEAALQPCAHALVRLQRKCSTGTLTAVNKKYVNAKFHEVAKLACPEGLGCDEAVPMNA